MCRAIVQLKMVLWSTCIGTCVHTGWGRSPGSYFSGGIYINHTPCSTLSDRLEIVMVLILPANKPEKVRNNQSQKKASVIAGPLVGQSTITNWEVLALFNRISDITELHGNRVKQFSSKKLACVASGARRTREGSERKSKGASSPRAWRARPIPLLPSPF